MSETPEANAATEALMRRWREGDKEALEQLLTVFQPWLHREMSKALGDRPRDVQDSLDFAQTAVLNFLTWGPKFVPKSSAQFAALLLRIATNGLIDERRRCDRERRLGSVASLERSKSGMSGFVPAAHSSLGPSREAERAESARWLRLALQFLEPDERYLLVASEVEHLDWATIAKELGFDSPDMARVRCARLMARVAGIIVRLQRGRMPNQS